eukprot:CAMPEP_0197390318 /NCGR_PEP_ID=MMETSP1165-20131217/2321_1 /TAXON_ID=284809 /ORGANISM="Chrysocystis fragilis, Strain CCMP3189" /LENGTH=706 /DNA_ID=CAMNT_0042915793 /DNA_START=17 /DNA_END=2137 /DNA_ORIENTATION=-
MRVCGFVASAAAMRPAAVRTVGCSRRRGMMATIQMTATVEGERNALLEQESLPKFTRIESSQVVPGVTALLDRFEADVAQLESRLSSSEKSYESTVEAAEKASAPVSYAWGVVGHLNGVKNSEELREAYAAMQPRVVEATTKLGQSKALYEGLLGLRELEGARKRIVEANALQMRLAGVGLEGAAKEQFNANRLQLSKLATDFQNNVLDATKQFELVVEDKADVAGLPESALALAAQRAGGSAEEGPWRLGLDAPSYLASMKYLDSSALRERLYRAFVSRAAEANEPLVAEILALRREQAALLGYETFAEVSLATKMADDVAAVDDLHARLAEVAVPAAKRELAELQRFAGVDSLAHWDVPYYAERLRESKFGINDEALRPYFALDAVLDGLFGLVSRLFGVAVRRGAAETWHPDVRFFDVFDGDRKLASFFLDPYSRPEDKRSGAWMDVCLGKSKALDRDVPVAYMVCNGSPPTADKPSLMTYNEVETLYHEMGHALQHMLTEVADADAAGINGVEWDAVELPSQFMENWLLHKPTLYSFAKHYETGEPLPDDVYDKLKAAKTFQAGMMMARQLSFGALDVELHARYDGSENPLDVQRRVFREYAPMAPLPEDTFLTAFSHIFAGGYSCGYYSYKWAEVMSADAFAAFEEAGLDNEDAVKEVGRRFRETVLALGGSAHPSVVYDKFRGRQPTVDALLRHSGLVAP